MAWIPLFCLTIHCWRATIFFPVFVIANKTIMNICENISFKFSMINGQECDHWVIRRYISNFIWKCPMIFQRGHTFLHFHQQSIRYPVYPCPLHHVLLSIFLKFSHSYGCVVSSKSFIHQLLNFRGKFCAYILTQFPQLHFLFYDFIYWDLLLCAL